jgi:hypothetical protein
VCDTAHGDAHAYDPWVRFAVASFACVTLGLLRDPGCSGVDDPKGGTNAPCTRSSDCGVGLTCAAGVCRGAEEDDGGSVKDGGDGGG